jgi:hypothetical protein
VPRVTRAFLPDREVIMDGPGSPCNTYPAPGGERWSRVAVPSSQVSNLSMPSSETDMAAQIVCVRHEPSPTDKFQTSNGYKWVPRTRKLILLALNLGLKTGRKFGTKPTVSKMYVYCQES